MDRIRVGIIGTGSMGRNHLRLLSELHYFDLIGFYDPSPQCAKYSEVYDTRSFANMDELIASVDAVSIAAPSSQHRDIAIKCAAAGKHTLVEKPLATNTQEANDILQAFENSGRVLMCGHVERFNPVVVELQKILIGSDIIAIDARRCSPWNGRISDVDVIADLMIHDMDIVINALNHGGIKNISATGSIVNSPNMIDYAQAIIKFDNGILASVVSSRVTEDKIRDIIVHTKESLVRADLLNRTLTITRQTSYISGNGSAPLYRQENVTERVFVAPVEPLRQELEHFAHCILHNEMPIVNGASSTRAISAIEKVAQLCYG